MKICFVTPWYGAAIPGGMEAETRRTADQLQQAGCQVEIVTTCIRDFFADWGRNYHRPGVALEEGIKVRRFPVTKGDRQLFRQINWRLKRGQLIDPAEERQFIQEMMPCPELLDYITTSDEETLFFFIPYLYATTVFGASIHPHRSAIIPCLHNESYAYLKIYKEVFSNVRALVFHTQSESSLAADLFGRPKDQLRPLIGEGVDPLPLPDPQRFREKYGLRNPFILVAGRKDRGKNTPLLLHYWRRFQQENERDWKLVLIGPGEVAIDESLENSVIDLGFVPMQDKVDAYAAADILCQPSVQESFSLVIMESWLAGTPVLVNGNCAVTKEHCLRSSGGLYFENYDEFVAAVGYISDHPLLAGQMGRNGRNYVLEHYQWPTIVDKYKQLIEQMKNAG